MPSFNAMAALGGGEVTRHAVARVSDLVRGQVNKTTTRRNDQQEVNPSDPMN